MQELRSIILNFTWADGIDILLVAAPFYIIFALLREARSLFALWGIISMLVLSLLLYLVAQVLDLDATSLVFEQFWVIVVLVFLIIFQGELKKAMTAVGRIRLFRVLFPPKTHMLGEVVGAIAEMARTKTGALIAFERSGSLDPYLTTGTILDASISSEVIRSVFTPHSPLHDGALIISGDRLVAGSCILPLSDDPGLSKELGTRHRAAIGLTEETDSLVVAVSEESGSISLAKDGKIELRLSPEELRKRLEQDLAAGSEAEEKDSHE